MRIIGVDPGLKATGYGVIELHAARPKVLEVGSIEPKVSLLIEQRLEKIHACLNSLIEQYSPDLMILEKLYAHYKHPTTAIKLGHARGVICLLSAQYKMQLVEYSVKRVRKALLGNGNATKQQVRHMIEQSFNIKEGQLTLDASDALALALAHASMVRLSV